MKKVFLGVFAAVIVLSVNTTSVFASHHRHSVTGNGCGGYYVDMNGDGICDGCGTSHRYGTGVYGCGVNYADVNGDGICDNCGISHRHGTEIGRAHV